MTIDDFRKSPVNTKFINDLLKDKKFSDALLTLQDSIYSSDAAESDPEIVSVRRLSSASGERFMLKKLLLLSVPFDEAPKDLVATFEPENNNL